MTVQKKRKEERKKKLTYENNGHLSFPVTRFRNQRSCQNPLLTLFKNSKSFFETLAKKPSEFLFRIWTNSSMIDLLCHKLMDDVATKKVKQSQRLEFDKLNLGQ